MKKKKGDRKNKKKNREVQIFPEQDENFAFIAGYTSWGFPYGVTWEEMEEINALVDDNEHSSSETDEELPFD